MSDSGEKKDETKPKVLDKPSIVLSEYGERLENHVKCRYLDKIAVIGVDPASLFNSQLDPECLPPVEAGDLVSYLVLETSFYTLQQFKCFKSLEAYNQMVSGFITSVQGKVVSDKFVVIGKVRHSQRMNEAPLSVWLISSKESSRGDGATSAPLLKPILRSHFLLVFFAHILRSHFLLVF